MGISQSSHTRRGCGGTPTDDGVEALVELYLCSRGSKRSLAADVRAVRARAAELRRAAAKERAAAVAEKRSAAGGEEGRRRTGETAGRHLRFELPSTQ